jgi:spermidine synthase
LKIVQLLNTKIRKLTKSKSNILKLCVFATGLSGVVAEYILATLATYFLGDSVVQWALIISVMLFSMGLGSRVSKIFRTNLLTTFIAIEFTLSLFVAFSSLMTYTTAAFTQYTGLIVYSLSILIGTMIGMEIPLVIRLNKEFESLRINVANVMEKDYYGSLLGGIFFVFVGLPYLGLTYTPFVLGSVNFSVALILFITTANTLTKKRQLFAWGASILVAALLIVGSFMAKPIIMFGEQAKYKDKVVFSQQSRYQKIVITQWKKDYWLFIDGNMQLSTMDEALYHEPLVHPAVYIARRPKNVLVMGGGDGCAVRELLKYNFIEKIIVCDLDPKMTDLARFNPIIRKLNENSMNNPKVKIVNVDGFQFISESNQIYDLIVIDLPDPRSVELSRLYSVEFYGLCRHSLGVNGAMVTHATSPYYAPLAFRCIEKTVRAAGFNVLPIHNQVLSMGEWGWVIGSPTLTKEEMMQSLSAARFDKIETKWLNNDGMKMMMYFGKDFYNKSGDSTRINKMNDPVLYRYYLRSNWDTY